MICIVPVVIYFNSSAFSSVIKQNGMSVTGPYCLYIIACPVLFDRACPFILRFSCSSIIQRTYDIWTFGIIHLKADHNFLSDFRDEQLVALLIMLGSPTTPTSYIMAKNMGHEGVLSASVTVVTTLLSALTITAWIFLLRSGGYIA